MFKGKINFTSFFCARDTLMQCIKALHKRFAKEAQTEPLHLLKLTEPELNTIVWLWCASKRMLDANQQIMPLLDVAEHKLAPQFSTMISEYQDIVAEARRLLIRETSEINCDRHDVGWNRVFRLLRG